jgi:hypothetical protein
LDRPDPLDRLDPFDLDPSDLDPSDLDPSDLDPSDLDPLPVAVSSGPPR